MSDQRMASRSTSAILWTLVSVNALSLVAGGLITWLGYASPARLRQLGLSSELVILGGSSALVIACIGLCALNYSSHQGLNVYGFCCIIFATVLLIGLPETWQRGQQTNSASLLIDFLYIALLIVLVILVMFAFLFSQHLRQNELEDDGQCFSGERLDDRDSQLGNPTCTCSNRRFTGNSDNRWLRASWSIRNLPNDAMNLVNRNGNHVGGQSGHHLSDLRVPMFVNNNNAYAGHERLADSPPCCNNLLAFHADSAQNLAAASAPTERTLRSRHQLSQSLTHKGFYAKSVNLTRTKSCSRQLGALKRPAKEAIEMEETQLDVSDCDNYKRRRDEDDAMEMDMEEEEEDGGANCKSASDQCLTSLGVAKDTGLVEYGRQSTVCHHRHRRWPNPSASISCSAQRAKKCECAGFARLATPLVSAHRSNAVPMLRNSYANSEDTVGNCGQYLRRQINHSSSQTATLPPNLMSSYAIRSNPVKIRAKGSSSVMASTVAAAAALFGGVADTSSLMHPNEAGVNCDGSFGCEADVDYSALIDSNGCQFQDSSQQLAFSMLDLPEASASYCGNVCQS